MPTALPPWYKVALPHSDIREGRLDESVFAANIWAVRQDNNPTTYLDPEQFFAKTYLTGGLTKGLLKAGNALGGLSEAGDRIISLQTAFGGGKTHTQVALWHLRQSVIRDMQDFHRKSCMSPFAPPKLQVTLLVPDRHCKAAAVQIDNAGAFCKFFGKAPFTVFSVYSPAGKGKQVPEMSRLPNTR